MNKKIISIIVILFLAAIFGYFSFLRKETQNFNVEEVKRGNVVEEISQDGQVKKGEEIKLSFKNSGRIEKIYVKVGEKVKKGDILAKLENKELKLQLEEAKANLAMIQTKLNKLLAGPSLEEIQLAKTAVNNAKIALDAAKQNLEDIKIQGENNLKSAYEDGLNVLEDSYLKIFNAFNTIDLIQKTYFPKNDQEGVIVLENKNKIEKALNQIKPFLEKAKTTLETEDIDIGLSETRKALEIVLDSLKIVRETCDTSNYKNIVSSTSKTSLDTHRELINSALANVINSQQIISSTKLVNTSNLNSYRAKVEMAEGQLRAAEDELNRILAPPRKEDIDMYKTQIKQAEIQISLLEDQIKETFLKSPVAGQIIKIEKKEGEMVQPMTRDIVICLLPDSPFQIKADIYEEDIVKIKEGNEVEISFVSFPGQVFKGKVTSINPTEKMKEGVVYYEVTIDFEEIPEGLKPGMSADLKIRTAFKENVLTISREAIKKENEKFFVEVLKGGTIEKREIQIGIGEEIVEVVSGLSEGEKVILR